MNAVAGVGQGLAAIPDAAVNAVGAVLGAATDAIPGVPEWVSDNLRTPITIGGSIERAIPTPPDMTGRAVRLASNFTGGMASIPRHVAEGIAATITERLPPRLFQGRRALAEARRSARAESLGYRETPYWHGDRSAGPLPERYDDGAFFSTRQEIADDHARMGGRARAREFRLRFNRPFVAEAYGENSLRSTGEVASVIRALQRLGHDHIAEGIASHWDMPANRFLAVADRRPNDPAMSGYALYALLRRQFSDRGARALREAGYDAIVGGHEVRKLTDTGIRLARARFDPLRDDSTHIRHAIIPLFLGEEVSVDSRHAVPE